MQAHNETNKQKKKTVGKIGNRTLGYPGVSVSPEMCPGLHMRRAGSGMPAQASRISTEMLTKAAKKTLQKYLLILTLRSTHQDQA